MAKKESPGVEAGAVVNEANCSGTLTKQTSTEQGYSFPDAICIQGDDGYMKLAANKKARRVLNKCFERPRPTWHGIARTPDSIINSPQYRALEIAAGPCLCAMLCALHAAGLTSMFWCENCEQLHLVNDEMAKELKFAAMSGAEGVMPAHGTAQ
jgi:hypothetical protein